MCVSWQMTAVGITENVKGDVKKFEIWYSGREEVYVVQVRRQGEGEHRQLLYCVAEQTFALQWKIEIFEFVFSPQMKKVFSDRN